MSVKILNGDMLEVLPTLEAGSFHSCVTDPPYHLTSIVNRFGADNAAPVKAGATGVYARSSAGFMGAKWDGGRVAFESDTWAQVYRVLKPGAHLAAFGGTRTWHRMAVAIEDAGFEIRDTLCWLYGCLDAETQVATAEGVKPYTEVRLGDLVLCYDALSGTYSYQPILDVVEYEYDDTAYRLVGDFGEQVVSRNHRVIVERGRAETFRPAETLQRQARVPVLESLHELQQALSDVQPHASIAQSDMLAGMHVSSGGCTPHGIDQACGGAQRQVSNGVFSVRDDRVPEYEVDTAGQEASLFLSVRRDFARSGVGNPCSQGAGGMDCEVRGGVHRENDRADQSFLEGWRHISEQEGCLRESANQVCSMPARVFGYGAQGRLCDATPSCRGTVDWTVSASRRGRASQEPRCDEQLDYEPDAVRDQCAPQGIRAWRGHKSAVVRVVPFRHVGKVWCLRVPTGAFVAVRGGVAFPTGNSGFPKSHNAERAVAMETCPLPGRHFGSSLPAPGKRLPGDHVCPTTPESEPWDGHGSALKPAFEPIILARKPLESKPVRVRLTAEVLAAWEARRCAHA